MVESTKKQQSLPDSKEETKTPSVINFYSDRKDFGFMSNFFRAPVQIDKKIWPSTEHYFQAQKFENEDLQEMIRK